MACNAALADMIDYLKQDGVRVAVFDATNSTRERRESHSRNAQTIRHWCQANVCRKYLRFDGIVGRKYYAKSNCRHRIIAA